MLPLRSFQIILLVPSNKTHVYLVSTGGHVIKTERLRLSELNLRLIIHLLIVYKHNMTPRLYCIIIETIIKYLIQDI